MSKPAKNAAASSPPLGASGCLVRLGWMLLGNAILAFSTIGILRHTESFLSVADAFYAGAIVAMIGLRYVDIRWLNGQTAAAEPATIAHWRRYALILGSAGFAGWGLAHTIAHGLM